MDMRAHKSICMLTESQKTFKKGEKPGEEAETEAAVKQNGMYSYLLHDIPAWTLRQDLSYVDFCLLNADWVL